MRATTATTETEQYYSPAHAGSGEPIQLSMQRLSLSGRILPVGARLFVRHDFVSAEPRPVEVVYCFMLPRDAALRRFRVAGPGFSAKSSLKPVREARDDYESALDRGSLGVLAQTYRDGVVNLQVGNLRPHEAVSVWLEILAGVDLRDDGLRFRFPFTLAPSYHARARAGQVASGAAEMELPEEEFGDVLLPQWREDEKGLHEVAFDLAIDWGGPVSEVSSPSHAIRLANLGEGPVRASLAPAAEAPNRDLVLDVRSRAAEPRVLAGEGRDGRRHFFAVVPSGQFGPAPKSRPPVVFLLDRSGSMGGLPIEQARRALAACLAALRDDEEFGIVAFDNAVESLGASLLRATADGRDQAGRFLKGIDARGGTQLAAGVLAAAEVLGARGGDIFLITDGQVFGAEEIIAKAGATGIRIHCLGIGSASQDRFLALLARATSGVSRFVTPRERIDTAALEVFASATGQVAEKLRVCAGGLQEMRLNPEPPATVRAGIPLCLLGDCTPNGAGNMIIEWEAAGETPGAPPLVLEVSVDAPEGTPGETLRLLRGARLISDLESRMETSPASGAAARRAENRLERRLEALSREYGLASRAMALVAVVERASDRPGAPPETRVVPVGLPQDMEVSGVFASLRLRPGTPAARRAMPVSADRRAAFRCPRASFASASLAAPIGVPVDELMELAAMLEPDGGMPGGDASDRLLKTLLAMLAFAAMGHRPNSGHFRMHLKRMVGFVKENLPGPLDQDQNQAARGVLRLVKKGPRPDACWLEVATKTLRGKEEPRWDPLLAEF